MKKTGTALALVATAFFSCKKPELKVPETPPAVNTPLQDGFGNNMDAIHGYMYAEKVNASWNQSAIYNYLALFSDPGKSYLNCIDRDMGFNSFTCDGNLDVGAVTMGGTGLFRQINFSTVLYMVNNTTAQPSTLKWTSEGNSSYKPLDVTLAKNFPVLNSNSFTVSTVYKSQGLSLDLSGASGYDSIIVSIGPSFNSVRKAFSGSVTSFSFSSTDLAPLTSSFSTNFSVNAYNYSNQTINGKLYVFELANRWDKMVYVYN
jgi:hypothetical protein